MKPETIKAIFTNLLFVIGVILTIVGFIQGTRTVVKSMVFDRYPLDTYEEGKCENNYITAPIVSTDGKYPEQKTEDVEATKRKCAESLEQERKVRKTEDIVGSVSFLVSGITLVYFFRRFILK